MSAGVFRRCRICRANTTPMAVTTTPAPSSSVNSVPMATPSRWRCPLPIICDSMICPPWLVPAHSMTIRLNVWLDTATAASPFFPT